MLSRPHGIVPCGRLVFFGGGQKFNPGSAPLHLPGLNFCYVIFASYPIVTIVAPNPYSRNEAS